MRTAFRSKYIASGLSATLAASLVYKYLYKPRSALQNPELIVGTDVISIPQTTSEFMPNHALETTPETASDDKQTVTDRKDEEQNLPEELKQIINQLRNQKIGYFKGKLSQESSQKLVELDPLEKEFKDTIVIALPLQLPEEYIDKLAEFLNSFKKSNNTEYKFKYKFIESKRDFTKLEEQTGTTFVDTDDSFSIISIYHNYLNKMMNYKLSDLVYDQNKLLKLFCKIEKVLNKEKLKSLIDDLKSDELVLAVDPKSENLNKFYEYIFQNECIRASKIRVALISKELYDEGSSDAIIAFHKQEYKDGDQLVNHKITDMKTKSIKEINGQLSASLNSYYVFNNPYIQSDPKKYRVIINFDKNLFKKSSIAKIKEVVRRVMDQYPDLRESFEIMTSHRKIGNSERHKIKVIALENKKHEDRMKMKYDNKDRKIFEERYAKEPELFDSLSLEYHLGDENLSVDNLAKFLGDVKHGRLEFGYNSQTPPAFSKYSRRLSGQNFNELVKGENKHEAIFYHSNSCGSCKKFLPLYEKMAYNNIQSGDGSLEFNRINNDDNSVPGGPIYPSTPRIVVYRADHKHRPYEYRSNVLTEQLLKDFIYTTVGFELVDEAVFSEKLGNFSPFFGDLQSENSN